MRAMEAALWLTNLGGSSRLSTFRPTLRGSPVPARPVHHHVAAGAGGAAGTLALLGTVRRKPASQLNAKRGPTTRKQKADPKLVKERKQLVKELGQQVPEGQGWLMDPAFFLQIEDAVSELEELNAVTFGADSGDLEGEWKVLFSSSNSLNAGTFGLLNGEARQVVKTRERTLTNTSSFLLGLLRFEWVTSWKAKGPLGMILGREDWYPILFGFRIGLVSASTDGIVTWQCTYTDEDMRIFRASKDTAPDQSSIFVLERL